MVAAFRTTDTQRGFIPSQKIQPNASSAGQNPDVCARVSPPLVTRQSRPSRNLRTYRALQAGAQRLICFEETECARWHAVRIYLWSLKALKLNAGHISETNVQSCCAPARPPLQDRTAEYKKGNFWQRSCHQLGC